MQSKNFKLRETNDLEPKFELAEKLIEKAKLNLRKTDLTALKLIEEKEKARKLAFDAGLF